MVEIPPSPSSNHPLIAPAVRTAFDVAVWLLDRARIDDIHLPLQKLQRLLFVAQAAYTDGLLMPAVFVADDLGPVEPNLQRLMSDGRPEDLPAEALSRQVETFLEETWRRFAHMPPDRLNSLVAKNAAYATALTAGRGTLIAQNALAGTFAAGSPKIAEDVRMLRSQSGTPVAVRAWRPGERIGS
jgi:uncharacterized phage-associated protein